MGPSHRLDGGSQQIGRSVVFGEGPVSLGHGFGVCVHEPPLLSSGYDEPLFGLTFNNEPLLPTDAITIEPGIYLDGWFGIRIEDDFLVDADGHEFLTSDLRRDLEYAMIMMEDYDPLPWHDPMAGDEESADRILPLPIGIIDVLMMAAVAALLARRNSDVRPLEA